MPTSERLIQKVETEEDWYATQEKRAVVIRSRKTDEEITRFEPPNAWGENWVWNLCEGGIYFQRSKPSDL